MFKLPNVAAGWRSWLGRMLPTTCLMCDAADADATGGLCATCFDALPINAPACQRCALPLPVAGVCGSCLRRPPPYEACVAATRYEWPANELVSRLKFRADLPVLQWADRLFAELLPRHYPDMHSGTLLVPVPLARRRLAERGFNQAQLLAERAARHSPARVSMALERIRDTAAQVGRSRAERRRNVLGAFRTRPGLSLHGADVVLVDDVITTGATLRACDEALRVAGVARVRVLALARAPKPGPNA